MKKLLLLSSVFLGIFALALPCAAQTAAIPGNGAPPLTPVKDVPPMAVTDILPQLEETSAFLKSVASRSEADQKTPSVFPALSETIDRRISSDSGAVNGRIPLEALRKGEAEWIAIKKQISDQTAVLNARALQIQDQLAKTKDWESRWQATLNAASDNETPEALVEKIKISITELKKSREQLIAGRTGLLALQEKVGIEEDRATAGLELIRNAREAVLDDLLVQINPVLWNVDFPNGIREGITKQVPAAIKNQLETVREYLRLQHGRFLIHGTILFLFLLVFAMASRRIRKLPGTESALQIFDFPVSSALILALILGIFLYPLPPQAWTLPLGAIAMLLGVRILRRSLSPVIRPSLNALVFLFFVDCLCKLAVDAPLIERLLFLAEMLCGIVFFACLLRGRLSLKKAVSEETRVIRMLRKPVILMLSLFAFSLVADIFGISSLARFIGHGAAASLFLALIVTNVLLIINGLIAYLLRCRPLRFLTMVKRHGATIEKHSIKAARFAAVAAWGLGTLRIFALLDQAYYYVKTGLTSPLRVRDFQISLMDFILIGGVIYLAVILSRFLRFFLKEEIYPRADLPRGIPFAVSTVVHYVVLIIGFLIALGLAGIDLTHLTVLLGALGVGIGFGLQNIINNFVSGLILLFERPLKVGDMVEVDGRTGELRRIGLRASVLRTFDGSEVIVPNGNLISNSVTNWTLSDQQRRIEVPVGVAYGTDPEKVIELLLPVAGNHKDILQDPEPRVLFVSFGDSSLNFVLRAWTNEFVRWQGVSSDLMVGVNRALKDAGISIPFPQRDLHIITPPEATAAKPPSGQKPGNQIPGPDNRDLV